MTPEQIALLQKSWQQATPVGDQLVTRFYDTLFTLDPGLRALFRNDMPGQRRKLIKVLNTVIRQLDNLQPLLPVVKALGERHVGYGVRDHDYDTVGAALISSLEYFLGDGFDEKTRTAWIQAYTLLSETMKAAAKNATGSGKSDPAQAEAA